MAEVRVGRGALVTHCSPKSSRVFKNILRYKRPPSGKRLSMLHYNRRLWRNSQKMFWLIHSNGEKVFDGFLHFHANWPIQVKTSFSFKTLLLVCNQSRLCWRSCLCNLNGKWKRNYSENWWSCCQNLIFISDLLTDYHNKSFLSQFL